MLKILLALLLIAAFSGCTFNINERDWPSEPPGVEPVAAPAPPVMLLPFNLLAEFTIPTSNRPQGHS